MPQCVREKKKKKKKKREDDKFVLIKANYRTSICLIIYYKLVTNRTFFVFFFLKVTNRTWLVSSVHFPFQEEKSNQTKRKTTFFYNQLKYIYIFF